MEVKVKQIRRCTSATNCMGIGQCRLYSAATGRSGSHIEQQTHSGDGISVFND